MDLENKLNRELSWIEFNKRVFAEAMNPQVPLLERVRFLGIVSSNFDEFFMKRVGGLKRQLSSKIAQLNVMGITPEQQLKLIREAVLPIQQQKGTYLTQKILPELNAEGIELVKWMDTTPEEREWLNAYFKSSIFPVLTPLAVDEGHPFPFISNLSTSLGLLIRTPGKESEELFARVKVPSIFPAWIQLPTPSENQYRFASAYELIGNNLEKLFPGLEILSVMVFRITRNADVERDDEDADDLLEMVSEEIRERRFANVVRLEHGPNPDPRIVKILTDEMGILPSDIYERPIWLEYGELSQIADLNIPKLRYVPWVPVIAPPLDDQEYNIFDLIRQNDILVHHPFESFTASVERFIKTATDDPTVIAIKMTLYRTGIDSPFIPYLIRAAEAGKQVACLVELQARFDEARNILVAQALERAGVHVVYGMVGLKTHCKIALVVRKEAKSVRSYVHIGTGNYHSLTALSYTDLGLFSAKPDSTDDIIHLFHYLTGRSLRWNFKKLLVAPIDMRQSFLRMIEREVLNKQRGVEAHIVLKLNNLEDEEMIQSLYRAAGLGVKIDLIIRSICCLRPGTPDLKGNLRVISIVGRFLEHSRVFYFRNGATEPEAGEFFMGSADWMHRNLSARVEAVTPIEEPQIKKRLWEILSTQLSDREQSWELQSDGSYQKTLNDNGSIGTHEELMKIALKSKRRFPSE